MVEECVQLINDLCVSSSSTQDEARKVIFQALALLESRPLRCREVQLVRAALTEIMQKFQLENDEKVASLINTRFSFEFIPGITKLGLEVTKPLEMEEIAVDVPTEPRKTTSSSVERGSLVLNVDTLNLTLSDRFYYLCSVKRTQTALWTSYRMYLDGTRQFDQNGALTTAVMNEAPVLLFGAKKFKSGPVAQCLIWNLPDVKLWKDKNAIGKLSRLQTSLYYGMPFPLDHTTDGCQPPSLSPLLQSLSVASFATEGSDHGLSPLPSPRVLAPAAAEFSTADAMTTNDEDREKAAMTAHPTNATNRSAPTRWSFRATTNAAPGQSNANTATGTLSALTAGGGGGGGIALALHSTGMDKLTQLSAVSYTLPRLRGVNLEPGAVATVEGEGSKVPIAAPSEEQMLIKLDDLQRKETAPSDFCNPNLLLLRSRLPRKVPSAGGKVAFSLPYSEVSRVRTPSRKNLVVDAVTASSSAEEAECAAEWTEDRSKPALLQVGH